MLVVVIFYTPQLLKIQHTHTHTHIYIFYLFSLNIIIMELYFRVNVCNKFYIFDSLLRLIYLVTKYGAIL